MVENTKITIMNLQSFVSFFIMLNFFLVIQINYIISDGLQTLKDPSFLLASGISKNRYVVHNILQTLTNTMEILMTLAFHQFTSKQTMNWPSEGRYQAELNHFHVCDLQSRPYSGLCSDTLKQSEATFLSYKLHNI